MANVMKNHKKVTGKCVCTSCNKSIELLVKAVIVCSCGKLMQEVTN